MGAQQTKLQKRARKLEKGMKFCVGGNECEKEDVYPYRLRHYAHSPTNDRRRSGPPRQVPVAQAPVVNQRPFSGHSDITVNSSVGMSCSPTDSLSTRHRRLSSTKSSNSWLEESFNSSWDSSFTSDASMGCASPPPRREQTLSADVTNFRHLHQHLGKLSSASRTSSSSTGSVGSACGGGPLRVTWNRLETDLEYYGMILLDKILEQEPQACYLMTFVRHSNISQLLTDLRQQRILAVRIMETVGLMVECAEDWKTAEPVLSSLARRHSVSAVELRYHIQVINSSLFAMLHVAMGGEWCAEMAVAWKALLAQVCDSLFNHIDTRSSSSSPSQSTGSSSLAWTAVKWKTGDGKDAGRKSSSPLPFKSLDDLTRNRASSARFSPISKIPALRLTRASSSSPTKETACRKSSTSAACMHHSPPPKSPLRRSWSSR